MPLALVVSVYVSFPSIGDFGVALVSIVMSSFVTYLLDVGFGVPLSKNVYVKTAFRFASWSTQSLPSTVHVHFSSPT